jgi:hypothetical protein
LYVCDKALRNMNRNRLFDYIEEKISLLALRIESRGRLNQLDLHNQSENFYAYFLNRLYGWELKNLNPENQNVEAIDLIDHKNKYFIQVSATCTKEKIESSLDKESLKNHKNYTFKFISIAKNADTLRTKTYKNPHNITFDPASDIIDKYSILKYVNSLDIDKQKEVYVFVKKELGDIEIDLLYLESNLATVIGVLSKENLTISDLNNTSFNIEKKIAHNELKIMADDIRLYSSYYQKLERCYSVFDKEGQNKSISVLQHIRRTYNQNRSKLKEADADDIFLQVVEDIKNEVLKSANHNPIPIEELGHCICIVVVHTFIECKIFENPENYKNATT